MTTIQRDCPNCPDPCKERHGRIFDMLFGVRDELGNLKYKGLIQRFQEQVAPGAQGPGSSGWLGHETQIIEKQASLRKEVGRYDRSWNTDENGNKGPCPDTPLIAEAKRWMDMPFPIAADWEANNPAEMGTLERVGWGLAGAAGIAVTGALILVPFDGPVGDYASGLLTAEAWRRAIFGAGALAAVAN